MRDTSTEDGPQSKSGKRRPRQSMNTLASPSRVKRRTGRRSSPAIWLETFRAVPLTFDSFSDSKGKRLRRWKSSREVRLQSRILTGMNGRLAHLKPGCTDGLFPPPFPRGLGGRPNKKERNHP